MSHRRSGGAVLLLFACLYALSIGRGFTSSDGEVMFQTAAALAQRGSLTLEPDPGLPQIVQGAAGRWFSKYDPGLPLLAVPFFAGGDWIARVNAAHRTQTAATAVLLLPALAAAGTLAALWSMAIRLGDGRQAQIAVLAAGVGTPLWVYARALFPEALLACALTCAVALLAPRKSDGRRRTVMAGLICGAGIAVRASFGVYVPALLLTVSATSRNREARWRRLLSFGVGLLPGVLLVLGHNVLRFDNPLHFGYAGEAFSTPVIKGALGLLISPGRGALIYAPPLLLSLALAGRFWREFPALARFLAIAWGSALLFYGAWWAWDGGWCWGPRLIVPLLPLSLLPLVRLPPGRFWWVASAGLVLLGALINAAGVLVDVVPHFAATAGGAAADVDGINWSVRESSVVWAVGQLFSGASEPLGLLRLGESGLPRTWALGAPIALGLGALWGAWGWLRREQ